MQLQILNKDVELAVENITTQVKRLKNGVVADAIKKAGIEYELSYGVSIVHLRKIATNYSKDNLLAGALWRKNWRETKILATMLAHCSEQNMQLLEEFTMDANTEEVLQQIGMNLLACFPTHNVVIDAYLKSDAYQKRIVACYAISRLFTGNNTGEWASEYTSGLMRIEAPERFSRMEIIAMSKAMAKVGFVSEIDNDEILRYFQELAKVSENWHLAYETIKTEFEYR